MMELELIPEVVEVKTLSFSSDDNLSPTVVYRTTLSEKEFGWLQGIYFWHQLTALKKQCNLPYERFVQAQTVWSFLQRFKMTYDKLTMEYDVEEDQYRIRPLIHKAPSQDIILKIHGFAGCDIDCVNRIPVLDKLSGSTPSTLEHYKYHYRVTPNELSDIGNLIGDIFGFMTRYRK